MMTGTDELNVAQGSSKKTARKSSGSVACMNNKRKLYGQQSDGSSICSHERQRNECRDCGVSSNSNIVSKDNPASESWLELDANKMRLKMNNGRLLLDASEPRLQLELSYVDNIMAIAAETAHTLSTRFIPIILRHRSCL